MSGNEEEIRKEIREFVKKENDDFLLIVVPKIKKKFGITYESAYSFVVNDFYRRHVVGVTNQ